MQYNKNIHYKYTPKKNFKRNRTCKFAPYRAADSKDSISLMIYYFCFSILCMMTTMMCEESGCIV